VLRDAYCEREKGKNERKSGGFLEKQGDIREKRRKFELNLKKQSHFIKRQNER